MSSHDWYHYRSYLMINLGILSSLHLGRNRDLGVDSELPQWSFWAKTGSESVQPRDTRLFHSKPMISMANRFASAEGGKIQK